MLSISARSSRCMPASSEARAAGKLAFVEGDGPCVCGAFAGEGAFHLCEQCEHGYGDLGQRRVVAGVDGDRITQGLDAHALLARFVHQVQAFAQVAPDAVEVGGHDGVAGAGVVAQLGEAGTVYGSAGLFVLPGPFGRDALCGKRIQLTFEVLVGGGYPCVAEFGHRSFPSATPTRVVSQNLIAHRLCGERFCDWNVRQHCALWASAGVIWRARSRNYGFATDYQAAASGGARSRSLVTEGLPVVLALTWHPAAPLPVRGLIQGTARRSQGS